MTQTASPAPGPSGSSDARWFEIHLIWAYFSFSSRGK
jgi:hypothetical protein